MYQLINILKVVSHLSMSDLSISHLKLAKSTFLANFHASTPVVFLKSAFVS